MLVLLSRNCEEFVVLGFDSFGLTKAASDCKASTWKTGVFVTLPGDESRCSRWEIGDRVEQAWDWWRTNCMSSADCSLCSDTRSAEDSVIIINVSSKAPILTIPVIGPNESFNEWGFEFVPVFCHFTWEAEPVGFPHVSNCRLTQSQGARNYHFWPTLSSEIP